MKRATASVQARHPARQQRVLVNGFGRIGDALWVSSLLPHLKRQGHDITVFVASRIAEEVLAHDPHIDRITRSRRLVGYDRAIDVFHAVANLLPPPDLAKHPCLAGTDRSRNFVERMHEDAEVPPPYAPRFYPLPEEAARARHLCLGARSVMICVAGSREHKVWPHAGNFAALVLRLPRTRVFLAGGPQDREHADRAHAHLVRVGAETGRVIDLMGMPIRETLALAQAVDVVVAPETGVPIAAAMTPNRKVILLGQSSPEKLTRDWLNTVALRPDVPCHPCNVCHQGPQTCRRGPSGSFAACMEEIAAERVFEAASDVLEAT